jgi:hypothetical protein
MSKLLLLAMAMLLWAPAPEAAPIAVRLPEGNFRGFLVLRSPDGTVIAHGEQSQRPIGNTLQSRLQLKFKDGSVFDETFTYTQAKVFRLDRYRLVQQGPSFPTMDVSFDRKSGQYQARTQAKKGDEEKTASGRLEIPDDVYNGLAGTLLKNLSAGASATAQMAAFTPKPIMLKMELSTEGDDRVSLGGQIMTAKRHLVKLDVVGLKGVIAPLVGKDPPDLRYWLVAGNVPVFVRFEGAMFLNGPVWRLEMTTVGWK